MLRRRTVLQDLPLYSNGKSLSSDNDWKKKQKGGSKLMTKNACAVSLLLFFGVGLVYLKSGSRRLYDYGEDKDRECKQWARQGECVNNRVWMLSMCPMSCHAVGVSVGTLSERDISQDATRGFAHFLHKGDDAECRDYAETCQVMAEEGKCMENSVYMLEHCPKSCLTCFGNKRTTVTIDFGVEQDITHHADPAVAEQIVNVIQRTHDYMVTEVFQDQQYVAVRRDCRNLDPHCSVYAAMGECHGTNDALAMFQNCAPACHACNAVEHFRRCARRPEHVDIFQPGDLNSMFQRIVQSYPKTTVLSQPTGEALSDDEVPLPWILLLDDFLTNEECDWLIAKGYEQGFHQTSEISDEIQQDGTFSDKIGQGRTSMDSWCQVGCEDHPVGKSIMDRMTNMTGIPIEYTEYMEILKYEEGGRYERHHDVIATQGQERCGNRMLTFYIFLSDVEEGGELRFNEIEKYVTPRKGRAVLWHNILDDDFDEMQTLTFHEAMPVKRGQKFGLNLCKCR